LKIYAPHAVRAENKWDAFEWKWPLAHPQANWLQS